MNDTYLSIDLDYWEKLPFPTDFFHSIFRSGFPIRVVNHHQQLIAHVDKLHCHDLINIDWHSDLANGVVEDGKGMVFNCGTWINFVKKPRHFQWYYPSNMCLSNESHGGYCHVGRNNPFIAKDPKAVCGWEKVEHIKGLPDPWYSNVKGIGIAISAYWGGDVHYEAFRKLWRQYEPQKVKNFRVNVDMDAFNWERPFIR